MTDLTKPIPSINLYQRNESELKLKSAFPVIQYESELHLPGFALEFSTDSAITPPGGATACDTRRIRCWLRAKGFLTHERQILPRQG